VLGSNLSPLAVLVLELMVEGDLHPYEMRQKLLGRRRDLRVRITPGSLYRTVERLAEDGLIEVVETSRAGRRPERTVYRVTEAGTDAYVERVKDMVAMPVEEYPQYATVLACVHSLSKQDALVALERRRMMLEAEVAGYDTVLERLGKDGHEPVYWIDVDYVQTMRRAELAWTAGLIENITWDRIDWPQGENG
jgi:DNA-binding PadR family transcriptional regulator